MRLAPLPVLVDFHGGRVQLGNARHGPRPLGGGFVDPSFDQASVRVGVVLGFDFVVRDVGGLRGVHVVGEHLLRGLIALEARGNGVGQALRTVRVASDRVGIGVLTGRFAIRRGGGSRKDRRSGGHVQRLLLEPFLFGANTERKIHIN